MQLVILIHPGTPEVQIPYSFADYMTCILISNIPCICLIYIIVYFNRIVRELIIPVLLTCSLTHHLKTLTKQHSGSITEKCVLWQVNTVQPN